MELGLVYGLGLLGSSEGGAGAPVVPVSVTVGAVPTGVGPLELGGKPVGWGLHYGVEMGQGAQVFFCD